MFSDIYEHLKINCILEFKIIMFKKSPDCGYTSFRELMFMQMFKPIL